MKRIILLFLVCLAGVLFAQHQPVTLQQAQHLAERNASALTEAKVYAAEPIPYYGPDEKIIAWHFIFSIDKPFPDSELLKASCDQARKRGDRKAGNGSGEFFNIVVGAHRGMPVAAEWARCLSQQYTLAKEMEQFVADKYPGGHEIVKTYYLGYANVWHQILSGGRFSYLNMQPYPKLLSAEEFHAKTDTMTFFWQKDEFEEDWVKFLDRNETFDRNSVMIPGEDKMPYYEWMLGCVPTAVAMHMAWYDHHLGCGRIIDWHGTYFQEYFYNMYRHHAPPLIQMLADAMGTDDEGGTWTWNIDGGYEDLFDWHGYECWTDSDYSPLYSSSHYFDNVKRQVNAGYPLHTGIPDHGITGVGYINSPAMFHAHDSNHPDLQTLCRSQLESTVEVYVTSGEFGNYLEIIRPNGDTGWYGMAGNGEVLLSGDIYPITWNSNSGSHVKILFNDDGGATGRWVDVTGYIPNTGSYDWVVPVINHPFHGNQTPWGRIRVVTTDNPPGNHLASDGSYGNFFILSGSGLPALSMAGNNTNSTPDYFSLELVDTNMWVAAGVRDNSSDGMDPWRVELYNAPNFSTMLHRSEPDDFYNLVVLNNYQLPVNEYGVKFYNPGTNILARANYAGDPTATLNMGTNSGLTWSSNYVVQMYNVYLSTGPKIFNMSFTGSADLDFALFKSGGDGIFSLQEAVASSRNQGAGVEESFLYGVTQAGWYGLLVMSRTTVNSTYSISIQAGASWTGAVSSVWTNTANWSAGFVPTNTTDVVIPAGCPNYPTITSGTAYVRNISIATGASVTIAAATLNVSMDLHVYGTVNLNNASSMLQIIGSALWKSGSTATAVTGSIIYCGRHWTFEQGSMVFLTAGTVTFYNSDNSRITSNSETSRFYHLKVNKPVDKTVTYNETSTQDLWIKGDLTVQAGTFYTQSSRTVLLEGALTNSGYIKFDEGTLKFAGASAFLYTSPGSYFHHIHLQTTQPIYMSSNLYLNGNLTIGQTSGNLHTQNFNIYIGGNWNNLKGINGFVEGTGFVVFNGNGDQYCSGESFYGLEIASPNTCVIFSGSTSIMIYKWTSGSIEAMSGIVVIMDLFNNGLFGNYRITGGTLEIYQDSDQYIDLSGNILITSGTMSVSGGSRNSYWPYAADSSIEMTGGVLDFTTRGIWIPLNASYPLSVSITGGKIRTAGIFYCQRPDFSVNGGTLELYGPNTAGLTLHPSNIISNLVINKGNTGSRDVMLMTNVTLQGSLFIDSGILKLNGYTLNVLGEMDVSGTLVMANEEEILRVYSSFYWNAGASAIIDLGIIELHSNMYIAANSSLVLGGENILTFLDTGDVSLVNQSSNCVFNYIYVETSGSLNIRDSVPFTVLNSIAVYAGTLYVNSPLTLSSLFNDSGSEVYVNTNLTLSSFTVFGYAQVNSSIITCLESFAVSGEVLLNNSSCIVDRPYTGWNLPILGNLNLVNSTLEITNNGIQFGTNAYVVMDNGTIKTGWNFFATNLNTFQPTNGNIEFIGARNALIQCNNGNYFHNLVINKPSGYAVTTDADININKDLSVVSGTFSPGAGTTTLIYEDLNVFADGVLNAAGAELKFVGYEPTVISAVPAITISTLTVYKQAGSTVDLNADLTLSGTTQMAIPRGFFRINDNTMMLNGSISVSQLAKLWLTEGSILDLANGSSITVSGLSTFKGFLEAMGSAANPAKITSSTGYYALNLNAGSVMKANYCIFEKMNSSGIHFYPGSALNTEFPMSNCTFQYGQNRGSLIWYDNDAATDYVIPNANFPVVLGINYKNVKKTTSVGSLTFLNVTGPHAGPTYEIDDYDTVHWIIAAIPDPPLNLTITTNGTVVSLNWSAVTGVTGYKIYRAASPDLIGEAELVGTTSQLTFTDTTYPAGSHGSGFYYVISYVD